MRCLRARIALRVLGPGRVAGVSSTVLVYLLVAAVLVFVLAAVVIGREAHRLDAVAPRSVYIPEEAMEFVAEYLPPSTQARLTPDELELLRGNARKLAKPTAAQDIVNECERLWSWRK